MRLRLCILFLGGLFLINPLFAQSDPIRIENEYKLSVPSEQVADLWDFLQSRYNTQEVQKLNPNYHTETSVEIFYDQYFDTKDRVLYDYKAGVRFRKRYVEDTLSKQMLQIKLPTGDSTGLARQEIKFDIYEKIQKGDLLAMHPLIKHLKPKDRKDFNRHLAFYGIKAEELSPSVRVKQKRRRVYISDAGIPLMTITLDDVQSTHFPFPKFTELELELNEIRYTDAGPEEKLFLENLNKEIKISIGKAFPDLVQNQTPKYNKMTDLLQANILHQLYNNFVYIILGIGMLYALFLYFRVYHFRNHAHKRQTKEVFSK